MKTIFSPDTVTVDGIMHAAQYSERGSRVYVTYNGQKHAFGPSDAEYVPAGLAASAAMFAELGEDAQAKRFAEALLAHYCNAAPEVEQIEVMAEQNTSEAEHAVTIAEQNPVEVVHIEDPAELFDDVSAAIEVAEAEADSVEEQEKRIAVIEASEEPADTPHVGQQELVRGDGWRFVLDETLARTRLIFDRRPSVEAVRAVEAARFFWSSRTQSYHKKLTNKAKRSAFELADKLRKVTA